MTLFKNQVIYDEIIDTKDNGYQGCTFRTENLYIKGWNHTFGQCNFNCNRVYVLGQGNKFVNCLFTSVYLDEVNNLHRDNHRWPFYNCKTRQLVLGRINLQGQVNLPEPHFHGKFLGFDKIKSLLLKELPFDSIPESEREYTSGGEIRTDRWNIVAPETKFQSIQNGDIIRNEDTGEILKVDSIVNSIIDEMYSEISRADNKARFLRAILGKSPDIFNRVEIWVDDLKMTNFIDFSEKLNLEPFTEFGYRIMVFEYPRLNKEFVLVPSDGKSDPFFAARHMVTCWDIKTLYPDLVKRFPEPNENHPCCSSREVDKIIIHDDEAKLDLPYDFSKHYLLPSFLLSESNSSIPSAEQSMIARRGGSFYVYPWGNDRVYADQYEVLESEELAPVGTKKHNGIGLYDVIGNMPELIESLDGLTPNVAGRMHNEELYYHDEPVLRNKLDLPNPGSYGIRLVKTL